METGLEAAILETAAHRNLIQCRKNKEIQRSEIGYVSKSLFLPLYPLLSKYQPRHGGKQTTHAFPLHNDHSATYFYHRLTTLMYYPVPPHPWNLQELCSVLPHRFLQEPTLGTLSLRLLLLPERGGVFHF
ncbi:hypothetical protein CR513_22798, partial [Mucuna pruriens]